MLHYNKQTPILFLVFNRPDTTALVFDEIKKAQPKRLYIAADGARNAVEEAKCNAVREIVKDITWDCEVKTLFREKNLGCKYAVSSAITWFFDNEPEGIILEDDCLPSQSFFGFCSELLEKYRNDNRIGHIGGSNFQDGIKRGDGTYYFSRLTHVWGWAGWRRVWKDYDVEMKTFKDFKEADLENSPTHSLHKATWYRNLENTYKGQINTWDYQYAYSNLINNYLSIMPNQNLIKNIGFGEDATHTFGDHHFANLQTGSIKEIKYPIFLMPNVEADIYTQNIEHPLPKKKNILSRTWKGIKNSIRRKN
ncbi:nucleotide-diphospho-sugar transferase [Pedobacter helvus]|uniref:Nucleotide-diphospho-sugar transferase n=1 Tax=Pedobacter helvus TaxID=2563444 RepID=A0ABW9JHB3_9SPHI|nr:nucleotide-diphospho-sugar transferase [Pedobacter ureilyticus]